MSYDIPNDVIEYLEFINKYPRLKQSFEIFKETFSQNAPENTLFAIPTELHEYLQVCAFLQDREMLKEVASKNAKYMAMITNIKL